MTLAWDEFSFSTFQEAHYSLQDSLDQVPDMPFWYLFCFVVLFTIIPCFYHFSCNLEYLKLNGQFFFVSVFTPLWMKKGNLSLWFGWAFLFVSYNLEDPYLLLGFWKNKNIYSLLYLCLMLFPTVWVMCHVWSTIDTWKSKCTRAALKKPNLVEDRSIPRVQAHFFPKNM